MMGNWALWTKNRKISKMCIVVYLAIWQTELGQKGNKNAPPAKWYSLVVQSAGSGEKVPQKNHKDLHQS
jgi:hypothetical protein